MGPIGALAITRHLVANLPYVIERDFQPIVVVAKGHLLLAVSPTVPFQTVTELVAYAKQNPGKLSNASSSNGSPGHVGGELFKFMTGTEIVHVPYKGGAPAINDLIAGRVQLMFESLNSIAPFARSGAVRALAVSGDRRSPAFPDLPTIAEAGVPGYSAPTWSGVIAPAGVPRPIVDKLNAAINKAIQSAAFKEHFACDRRRARRRHARGIRRFDRVGFGQMGRSDQARRHQVRVAFVIPDCRKAASPESHIPCAGAIDSGFLDALGPGMTSTFLAAGLDPYWGHGETPRPRSRKAFEKRPGQADPRQGGAAGFLAARPGAR